MLLDRARARRYTGSDVLYGFSFDRFGWWRFTQLALNIGDEVAGQNAYLDGMNSTFDSAGERLSVSLRALQALSSSGAGGHMCILFVFAFLFLFLIYLLLTKRI